MNVPFPEGWLEIVSSSLFTTSPVSMVLLNIFALEVPGKVDLKKKLKKWKKKSKRVQNHDIKEHQIITRLNLLPKLQHYA